MLARFNIIVAFDDDYGIGRNGTIPWHDKADLKRFKETTLNATVIMGRKTYESIPNRPLKGRSNIVITNTNLNESSDKLLTAPNLHEALKLVFAVPNFALSDLVYVIGGEQVYKEALSKYAYLCDEIFVTHIPNTHQCDRFFPYVEAVNLSNRIVTEHDKLTRTLTLNQKHPEQQYLDLLNEILCEDNIRKDRTGVGIKSIFGRTMIFDLRKGFPLFTTKRVWFAGIKKELLFFIKGDCDSKKLEAQGVNIWQGNTSEKFLKDHNLPWKEGDMGPMYPFQWRHAGENYQGCDKEYKGIDQLQNVIDNIKKDPFSRRHIISAWDVANIDKMVLPPCHCFLQFYVATNLDEVPMYLDLAVYQRSADMFLGVPFNIASYALLLSMIAKLTGLIARKLIYNFGDLHVYSNHMDQVEEQIDRTPYPFCTLKFKREVENINDFKVEDIELIDYLHWPKLEGEMAI